MLNSVIYREYKKNSDIHGSVLYPATMVPPIQKEILSMLIQNDSITSIFDPFHGSGTSLYEALMVSPKIHLVGCDINPLANLITKVKLQGTNNSIVTDIRKLKERITKPTHLYELSFKNMHKWFREDILESIQEIRSAIIDTKDDRNRLFFWYILCDIIRRYSNTRSSTYKLHIMRETDICKMSNNVTLDYLNSLIHNYPKFIYHSNNYILYKKDILSLMPTFEDQSFDISITSPPYGDNATTVPYGQFSALSLYIIDQKDLELEGWELDNYSIIDRYSLGGMKKDNKMNAFEKTLIDPYLQRISPDKQIKVINFFNDYFQFLEGLCRITKKYIVLTLGNRTVDGIRINLTDITKNFLKEYNFSNIEYAKRMIPIKRIPKITSNVNNAPVSSMNVEYLLINKRI